MEFKRVSEFFETSEGNRLYQKILSTILCNNMTKYIKNGVLVGFSGGADSVFLLIFLMEYRNRTTQFPIAALHVNHGIRGDEAERDADFCRDLCAKMGVEFLLSKVDCVSSSKELSCGIEETARILRYAEFDKILNERNDLSCVAVAHNSTDNLETVIQRMMRGCGGVGLCGIPAVRDNIVRPLLDVSSDEIRRFLTENNIPFVFDSSNNDNHFTRNKIRNEILPIMREISQNPEDAVSKMCRNIKEDSDALSYIADSFLENCKDGFLSISALCELPEAVFSRVIQKFHQRYSDIWLEERHVRELFQNTLAKKSFSLSVPGGLNISSNGKQLYEKSSISVPSEFNFEISNGLSLFKEQKFAVCFDSEYEKSLLNIYKSSISVSISNAIINGKVRVRNRQDGDAWRYGNMTHKLKKLYNDKKIPESVRDILPVFYDDNGILWVPGFGVRDGIKSANDVHTITVFFTYDYPLANGEKKGLV